VDQYTHTHAHTHTQLEEYEESVREYERACQLDQDNRDLKIRLRDAKLELKKSKRKNYYKILEVAKDAQVF